MLIFTIQTEQLSISSSSAKIEENKKRMIVDVDGNGQYFYQVNVISKNGQIWIQIVDQQGIYQRLYFQSSNIYEFIDSFKNLILVKQASRQNEQIALKWQIIQILYNKKSGYFQLDSFFVSGNIDDEFCDISKGEFKIVKILEYEQKQKWISVLATVQEPRSVVVYKIHVGEKINVLFTVSVFSRGHENITGGNSKVLYDQRNDQFLVDTSNCRVAVTDLTVFGKIPVSQLTKIDIYKGGGKVYDLFAWNFQYVSQAYDKKSLTAFVYSGYGDVPIRGQASLIESTRSIKLFYDSYNYFTAISSSDIYLTNIYWDSVRFEHKFFSNTLSNIIEDQKKREQIVDDWYKAHLVIYVYEKFYLLSDNKFTIYSTNPTYFTRRYQLQFTKNPYQQIIWSRTLVQQIRKYKLKKIQSDSGY